MAARDPDPPASTQEHPTRLARRLTTTDATFVGLGAMLGAGVFAAFSPAARAAGNALLIGLALAALVACCNASSSARLAVVYPTSGGTYAYAREELGPAWGFLAGWAFVIGKLASCAAMALTLGSYALPSLARPIAIAAVIVVTAIDYRGVEKTAAVTRVLVTLVLTTLATSVVALWLGGTSDPARVWPPNDVRVSGVLESAAFLFFAFAGYARVATLGEEVARPERAIPRAIGLALVVTFVVYAIVGVTLVASIDARALAASTAPLATAVEAGGAAWLAPVVRAGAAIASLSVLVSLIAGVGRTAFAMASNRDLPTFVAQVHPIHRTPARATLATGAVVAAIVAAADVRSAIGFSSFSVLVYYALTNAAAWRLSTRSVLIRRAVAAVGGLGCVALAMTLPLRSVLVGAGLLSVGALLRFVLRRNR